MTTSLSYRLGTRTVSEIRSDIHAFWQEVQDDKDLAARVEQLGVPLMSHDLAMYERAVTVEPVDMGLDSNDVSIIVSFAPSVNLIIKGVWNELIVPWIRTKRGTDSILDPDADQ